MPKGKFGLPRPFADVRPLITIKTYFGEKISKARIHSANGYTTRIGEQGELNEYFNITGIDIIEAQDPPDSVERKYDTPYAHLVGVNISKNYLQMSDVIMFHSTLNDVVDEMRSLRYTHILPSSEVNRRLVDTHSSTPKLIILFRTPRGSIQEFRNDVEELVDTPPIHKLLKIDTYKEMKTAYVLATGIELSDARKMGNKILGPNKKRVTDVGFDAVIVEEKKINEVINNG